MNIKQIVRRMRRDNTPEHALASAAVTFGGFVAISQFSIALAAVLLVAFLILKNG